MLKKIVGICALLLSVCGLANADTVKVRMQTSLGDIDIEVFADKAPITAANFLRYVDEGRYKNAQFYRVVTRQNQPQSPVKIEVIQGGLSFDGTHPLELAPIAHETTAMTGIQHVDGVVSMARTTPGSASSEIFICVGDQPELDFGGKRNPDGQGFAAFGRVIRGMEVVKKIQAGAEKDQMLIAPVGFRAERIK